MILTSNRSSESLNTFSDDLFYSGLTLNQDKTTKPQTVQIVRQGEATPYWFKVNPL
ncbi:transposase [Neisseria mucosa]|uniref:Transposase n=1 Tax=Neisseria mucosa TaxID=488 RepID=A0ABM6JG28_NEIMU|nr:transposase [Neisseria mucosa]